MLKIIILCILLGYLGGAFFEWNLNPSGWRQDVRGFTVGASGVIIGIAGIMNWIIKPDVYR